MPINFGRNESSKVTLVTNKVLFLNVGPEVVMLTISGILGKIITLQKSNFTDQFIGARISKILTFSALQK